MAGREAIVKQVKKNGLRGQVLVEGERWSFRSKTGVSEGESVEVVHQKGLTLEIRPLDKKENNDA